jgi:aspartate/tyrosine/aromatic aminotransferase
MTFFESLELLPDDPILSLPLVFAADTRPYKVNLSVGAYRTSEGKPLVLPSVRKAEQFLWEKGLNKEYLPIDGDPEFNRLALQLVYGQGHEREGTVGAQTVGGTGALKVVAEFLANEVSNKKIFIPNPSWPNHKAIFKKSGLTVEHYPYYHPTTHGLDFDGMKGAIEAMPPLSVIVLHACCHNPTGIDPTWEQWVEICRLIQSRQLIPLFDFAYQGFGDSLQEDAKVIRYFAQQGVEFFTASSYAKNFGLYAERIGLLSAVIRNKEGAKKINSHFKTIIRGIYSNPPAHGARIVAEILGSETLTKEWEREVNAMRERVQEMRKALIAGLLAEHSPVDFSFMANQKGIFSYSGLTKDQSLKLRQDHAIYLPTDGRINVAGLNHHNLEYVIEAILTVLQS